MSELDFLVGEFIFKAKILGLQGEEIMDYVYFILEDIYEIELD